MLIELLQCFGILVVVTALTVLLGWYVTRHHDPSTWEEQSKEWVGITPQELQISFGLNLQELRECLQRMGESSQEAAEALKKLGITYKEAGLDDGDDEQTPTPV